MTTKITTRTTTKITTKITELLAAVVAPGTCLLVVMSGGLGRVQAAEPQDVGDAPPPVHDQAAAQAAAPAPPLPASSPDAVPLLLVDGEPSASGPSPQRRPRFSMGVGMGVSFDSTGLVDARTVAVPAFQVQLGVGEDVFGFELRLFSTQASGRFHRRAASPTMLSQVDTPADRLAVDILLALRPFAAAYRDDPGWWRRVLKSVTVNAGGAGENATTGTPAVVRFGGVLGFHIDLPLVPPAASSLSLRITGRKMVARQASAASTVVTDTSGELFGGLALSF